MRFVEFMTRAEADNIRHRLELTRAKLSERTAWCKNEMALSSRGLRCACNAINASAWSLWGALYSTYDPTAQPDTFELAYLYVTDSVTALFGKQTGTSALCAFNDDPYRIHSEVLSVIDHAIANLRTIRVK